MSEDTNLVKSVKRKPPAAGMGRPKGAQNKTTTLLKDAILQAANEAGGKGGMVEYLRKQAIDTPGPFLALLGKVLPTQVTGEGGGPIRIAAVEWSIVNSPEAADSESVPSPSRA